LNLFGLPDVLALGAATPQGQLEAVTVFGYTAFAGDFLFNVSAGSGRRWSSLLLWSGALELRARGVRYLNLGGGVRRGDGIAEYKRRFGGAALPLVAAKEVYRPDIYRRLCREAGVQPALTGYFPPYQRPSDDDPYRLDRRSASDGASTQDVEPVP
jgi:hypothetical protein